MADELAAGEPAKARRVRRPALRSVCAAVLQQRWWWWMVLGGLLALMLEMALAETKGMRE